MKHYLTALSASLSLVTVISPVLPQLNNTSIVEVKENNPTQPITGHIGYSYAYQSKEVDDKTYTTKRYFLLNWKEYADNWDEFTKNYPTLTFNNGSKLRISSQFGFKVDINPFGNTKDIQLESSKTAISNVDIPHYALVPLFANVSINAQIWVWHDNDSIYWQFAFNLKAEYISETPEVSITLNDFIIN